MKKLLIAFSVTLGLALSIYLVNHFQLQSHMNAVLDSDSRNKGIDVAVHYEYYIKPSILVYDLKSVSSSNSMVDVFRVFLHFSEKVKTKHFDVVCLSFQGRAKFEIHGDYFQTIGKESSYQNPLYTMRTFPEHLLNSDGSKPFGVWKGGILGVLTEQMKDFNEFNRKWYVDDLTKK